MKLKTKLFLLLVTAPIWLWFAIVWLWILDIWDAR